MTIADRATFIAGSPRSGTTLMTAMLDDHPDLVVFPEEHLYVRPQDLPGDDSRPVLREILKEKVVLRLQGKDSFLDAMHEEGRDYADFDYQRFEAEVDACFQSILGEPHGAKRSVTALGLIALMTAFARVTGNEQHSRWVLKNPHYELYWQQLFADFPSARMIYLVRDPRDVILSRTIKKDKKKHLRQGGDVLSWKDEAIALKPSVRFLKQWEHSINAYLEIKEAFPGQIMRVRYEDLVASPREVMREVSEFLGVGWNESLSTPSFLGTPWKGGSMHRQSFDGIGRLDEKGMRKFSPHVLWQLEAWLGDVIVKEPGGYALSAQLEGMDIKALLSRLHGEGVSEFVRNRLRMLSNQRNRSTRTRDDPGGAPGR
jgi:hypothetical protein